MSSLVPDLATALRFFSRRRVAFCVAAVTMALALGANTAVFAVLKAFLFSHLAVPEPERVVVVSTTKELPGRGLVDFSDAYPNYKLLRDTTHFFEAIGATLPYDVNWQIPNGTRRLPGVRATASFFAVMRVRPVVGRLFTAQDEGPKAAPIAVIGYALWQSAFGGAGDVVGRVLRLNEVPHTIVGVLPPDFSQPYGAEIWLPFDLPETMWTAIVGARQLNTFARLAPGATIATANAELRRFAPRATDANPHNKDWGWRVRSLREDFLSGADNALVFVQCGAAVLLVLAVSNLASLLMAWAAERRPETALRLALGASAWRLVRQFLVQSVVLVATGGAFGLVLAWLTLPALQYLNPNPALGRFLTQLKLDGDTLAFGAVLSLGVGLISGLLPASQACAVSCYQTLRRDSRGTSLSRGALQWQEAMVVLQAAVSVLILIGAGLAGLGFWKLSQVRLGFATEGRVAMRVQFHEPTYATNEQRARLVRTLSENLAREPSLLASGFTTTLPVSDVQWGGGFHPELPSGEFTADPHVFHYRRVSPSYLAAMEIPLLEGRLLNAGDRSDAPPVAIVSKALAETYWPGRSAIGRKLRRVAPPESPPVEIVGVVGNVHDAGAGFPAAETVYVPFEQAPLRRGTIVLHGRGSVDETIAAGKRALRATDANLAAYDIATLERLAWEANALPRLQVTLLGIFAVIAVGIAALGSYGVMSQLVANRQKEMAIRAALGATPGRVLCAVLWKNARLAAVGTAFGLVTGWIAAQTLEAQLTGFDAKPLWPYAAVAGTVLLLTQLASFVPAWRAVKLDVPTALNGE